MLAKLAPQTNICENMAILLSFNVQRKTTDSYTLSSYAGNEDNASYLPKSAFLLSRGSAQHLVLVKSKQGYAYVYVI